MTHKMKKFIKNRIAELLKQEESRGFKFIPDRNFYDSIGIKQKRWGQLIRNEIPATTEEIYKVAEYFKLEYSHILNLQQPEQ